MSFRVIVCLLPTNILYTKCVPFSTPLAKKPNSSAYRRSCAEGRRSVRGRSHAERGNENEDDGLVLGVGIWNVNRGGAWNHDWGQGWSEEVRLLAKLEFLGRANPPLWRNPASALAGGEVPVAG